MNEASLRTQIPRVHHSDLLSRGGEAGVGEAGKDTEDWFQGGSGNELLTQTGPLTLGKMSNSQVHEESTVET